MKTAPLTVPDAPADTSRDKPPAGARPPRILVVEDECITALALKLSLLKLGYKVPEIVDNGEAAVSKADELKPDLIFMDITLAGPMNGIEAVREIHKKQAVPIIYTTAHTDQETYRKAGETVFFGYLIKPYDLNTLDSTIMMALRPSESGVQQLSPR